MLFCSFFFLKLVYVINRVYNPPPQPLEGLPGAGGGWGASPGFQPPGRKRLYVGENVLEKKGIRGLGGWGAGFGG